MIMCYCVKTCTTSNGTLIPKCAIVYIPAYNVHHSAKLWPDPEKFDPEDFILIGKELLILQLTLHSEVALECILANNIHTSRLKWQ